MATNVTNRLMMNNRFKSLPFLLFILLYFGSTINGFAAKQKGAKASHPKKSELVQKIDSLLSDSDLGSCFIGLKIVSLEKGTILYSKNSSKLFQPASNMKLLTTATANSVLGANYEFNTELLSNAKTVNGVLQGDLLIKCSGDPKLGTADFDSLASQLSKVGIKSIKGNLVGDTSAFDGHFWGAGWMWDDEPEAFEAFITPLTVNSNAIKFKLSPGIKDGDSLRYFLEPAISFYKVINQGVTSNDSMIPRVKVTRPKGDNTFTIIGRLNLSDTTNEYDVSMWKPEMYFLKLLKQRLDTTGITVQGKCLLDSTRRGKKIAEVSHSLDSVLCEINKPSDNLGAENLLKTLGREKIGAPGSAESGLMVVKDYLLKCGIDTSEVMLADGSGLSGYDEVSPDAFLKILRNQFKQKLFSRFYQSLPIAGVDGTLKNRMKGTKAEGNVHAKTGSITGASTLSGYVTTADSSMLCFSFMCNHFPGDMHVIRHIEDRILEMLAGMKVK